MLYGRSEAPTPAVAAALGRMAEEDGELEESLTVDLVCVWDRLNGNPHITTFVNAFDL